ncbi:MerR family transcriptional regulator [Nocardia sp. AG03]|uniref:MerR family transcriptional regulator n=1 Tax=Nocardia sp. AG03 TaxID=3025312 RepID=UPI0024186B90|nr:MerR family transcriptional regulator [Nocardia sp. AG03]
MPELDRRTVGAAAALLGVTVRTLHHWDAIGLVRPSERTPAGYRLYTVADLARGQRVLVYRELGVALDEIGALLDASTDAGLATLRAQRARLGTRIARLQRMAAAVDRMIEAGHSGIALTDEEQIALFGPHWQPAWVDQARARWGDTAAWAQYAERAEGRTRAEWERITAATEALHADLTAAFRSGLHPGTPEANTLAERHRDSFTPYFDCTHAMHVCLARGYLDDPGYTDFYDALAPGFTPWLHDVITANALAHGVDPATATWD